MMLRLHHERETAEQRRKLRGCQCHRKVSAPRRHREIARVRPEDALSRMEAQADLVSANPRTRKAAAERLGNHRYLESYGPLLDALKRECREGFGSREAKLAIIGALDKIGAAHVKQDFARLRAGHGPLKAFILSHLGDADLARCALKSLSWTGDHTHVSSAAEDIRDAAFKAGKSGTAQVASDFIMDLIRRD